MTRLFSSTARLGAAAAIALAMTGQVLAQAADSGGWFPFKIPGLTTGSIAPSAPLPPASAAPGSPPEWSGESGSSGHPLMTADAIRAAAADFHACLEGLWPEAARRGVPRAVFDAQTAALTPDLRIMDLLDAQPEFTKAIWDYLDLLVSDDRIKNGRTILAQHRAIFDAVEKAYGVDRHVITAIWGVESNYGTQGGQRPVVRSTATLACIGRRQDYFREEFLSALEILAHGDVDAAHLQGSWAGAFGPTQFMPTSFKKYAVDFDGDGRRDVVDSIPDLIASTANNLKKDGWATGQTWGYEVVVPERFNFMLADRARLMTMQEWMRAGIGRPGGKAFPRLDDRAYLLVPAGAQGPGFLMLQNFRVIMKYNPSEAYALAIGYLADRLRGSEPLVQPWPRYERVLTRDERLELQQQLASHGFDVGSPDGQLGGRTRAALRQFQAQIGFVPDGFASAAILDRLRRP
ncbi:MAG TPA: lytic murein transglycosylase [Xanthobacteraceae bacterium]|nr:lytic murein transglycosylase [Xanthobacteraceae bacterium]